MSLIVATLAVAGVGLALTHDVVLAQTVDPAESRESRAVNACLVVGGWAVLLLAVVIDRHRLDLPVEHEHALAAVMHADVTHRLDTYREDR